MTHISDDLDCLTVTKERGVTDLPGVRVQSPLHFSDTVAQSLIPFSFFWALKALKASVCSQEELLRLGHIRMGLGPVETGVCSCFDPKSGGLTSLF